MQDDLISRQAAIDAISCDITVTGRQNAELVAKTIGTFADRIKALPTIKPKVLACGSGILVEDSDPDVIRVVRCKDCKWWTKQMDSLQGRCALLGMYPTGEWYCANAKMEVEHERHDIPR